MSIIGMDISSNRIAVAEIDKKRKSFALLNAAVFEVPQQVIEKGEIKDTRVVSSALRDIWKHYRFGSRKVLVGLSNPKVIIKEIQVPVTSDTEIESSIKLQINDLVPIAKNNITYDYFVSEKGKDFSRIMIAGAAKNMIDGIVESLRDVKINPESIDLNCFSLYRVMNYIYGFKKVESDKEKSAYCLVNIGKDISIINMVTGNELKFPRFSNISVKTFIDSVSKKLGINYFQTEQILDSFDFDQAFDIQFDRKLGSGEKSNGSGQQATAQDPDISTTVREAGTQFVDEINRSIDYFINRYSSYNIHKILISGDTFTNFDKFIEKEIGYKVEQVDISSHFSMEPLKRKDYYRDRQLKLLGNQLTLAIGMALRGFGL
ncbi:MAG: type IV pilus assembly protein PilM [Actinomycetota bacterium]